MGGDMEQTDRRNATDSNQNGTADIYGNQTGSFEF